MRMAKLILIFFAIIGAARAVRADAGDHGPMPRVQIAQPQPQWNADFAGGSGWIGADGVYSAPLPKGRIAWIFSDTFMGKVADGHRQGAVMVNNTIAIQGGIDPKTGVEFYAGKHSGGEPASLIVPADGKGWFWPQAAAMAGDRLALFLARIERNGGGAFGFRQTGETLAIVQNPADAPNLWRMTQTPLPNVRYHADQTLSWGSAILADGPWLYIYGFHEAGHAFGTRQLVVARVEADNVADFAAWRYFTGDVWSASDADAKDLAGALATEFSVTPFFGGGYVLVYTEGGLGDRIVARFAPAPQGPWSEPLLLYTSPQMKQDKGLFCYAAKAHAWAADGRSILISYCVNAWDFGRVLRDASVYRPLFVRVTFDIRARKSEPERR